jgi:hydroxyacyl-ACP dehydratase HTD2-like protein with hotdog domain
VSGPEPEAAGPREPEAARRPEPAAAAPPGPEAGGPPEPAAAGSPELSALLARWAPEPAEVTELITAEPAVALAGLLDAESPVSGPGDAIPPLWHWLYFLDRPAQRDLGPDGHPAQGRFMPPIPRRRRMYAGGRVSYLSPLRCGDQITRRSELAGWRIRPGRSGELLFVTVRHTFRRDGVPVASEEQDLVYRSAPAPAGQLPAGPVPAAAPPAATSPDAGRATSPAAGTPAAAGPHARVTPVSDAAGSWELQVVTDPVMLFRFSALTYNAHRIHYDAQYATSVEGHPGLVVHGPLIALLCLELPRRHRPGRLVPELSFRARSPLYAEQLLTVTGRPRDDGCEMRVTAPDGTEAMTATGRLAP